ncbi:MAG: glycosyltransferase [Aquincola sp.]|nr:glycosyltransferase [Aquincola sp.]
MDRLTAMQTFVRVVESGSFTAVAREMHSTQSAVSKQVAALERQLGARLLSRSTRSLALTEEGERYFEQARRLVAEIAEAEASLREGEQQLTGWLRVAASVGFGRLRVLPLVQQFMAQHPGVRIDLRLHDGFIDLVEHGIDLAVRIGELADSSLVARRVATSQRAVLASRRYLQSLPRSLRTPRTLDVVGTGNMEAKLKAQAERLGLAERVRWHGYQPNPQDWMRAAKCVVVPSFWQEPYGLVAAEAVALGRSVVAFDIGGLPEACQGKATLVPPGDVDALARALDGAGECAAEMV